MSLKVYTPPPTFLFVSLSLPDFSLLLPYLYFGLIISYFDM